MFTHKAFHEPVFIFLHAFPLHGKMWQDQQAFLQSKGINSLAVDYPGFGNTPPTTQSFSMESLAKLVIKTVSDFNIQNIILVGCSMGGYLAFEIFRQVPDRIKGLILSNTKASADTSEAREKRMEFIRKIKSTNNIDFIKQLHLDKFFALETRSAHPERIKFVENLMKQITVSGVVHALQAMADRPDSRELLPQIPFPVFIIQGGEDPFIPSEEITIMKENIPDNKVIHFEKCGHLCNIEAPEKFNRILLDYFQLISG